MKGKQNISLYVPFTDVKKSDEERMVFGYCTSESLDSQGEIVKHSAIIKAWDKYMEYANIREMHQPSAVGVTKEYTHDSAGTFIGVKVVDDRAWKFVKEGVYKGFSIGGRVVKKNKNIIEEIILSEISLVDRPANPDAMFSVTKVDDGLVDRLQLEASEINKMKKFIEIDGVKYVEDPENVGQPLKDESGNNVVFVEDITEEKEEEGVKEEEKVEDEKEAEEKVEEKVEPTPEPEKTDEGEKAEAVSWSKKAEQAGLLTKDSGGVLMLASLLDHVEYVMSCFASDSKDVVMLEPIRDALMQAVAMEAGEEKEIEASEKTGDLTKMFSSELSKAVAPLMEKLTGIRDTVSKLEERVKTVENTRVSPRPKGAVAVEKAIEKGLPTGSKDLVAKRKELEAVTQEINEFALEWGKKVQDNPSLTETFMSKSNELHKRLSSVKREVNELLAETGGM